MPRRIKFVLDERFDAPGTLTMDVGNDEDAVAVAAGNYSRHHIVGRKYLQMLTHLLVEFEYVTVADRSVREADQVIATCDARVRKFAEYQGNNLRALKGALFWSPWNLFVGPKGEFRTFDPSSGMEQVKPKGFPDDRWKALKQVPLTLEDLGVSLVNVVTADNGDELNFTLKVEDATAKTRLNALLDALKAACPEKQTGKPYRFNPDEWAVVDTSRDSKGILKVTSSAGAQTQYAQAETHKLIASNKTWRDVASQPAGRETHKMIIKP